MDIISQVRSGALDFIAMNSGLLGSLAPVTAVTTIGFAFKNYEQVWQATDNELGVVLRASLAKAGVHAFKNAWDLGFHQITSSKGPIKTPDDFNALKVRAPNSPIYISFFQGIGAAPVAIPFPETYSALQAKIADAQGQSLSTLYSAKLYEVQKYLSLTRHIWNDTFIMANPRIFSKLPAAVQESITKQFDAAALLQREDIVKAEGPILADLKTKGVVINDTQPEAFRERLKKSDYYPTWKKKVGEEAWDKLEKVVGKLT
jgi:tripartite ATP-independent transporter DctP family solute receptor